MQKIKACFILENGKYIEVPVTCVMEDGRYKEEFEGRYFFPFGEYLLEMSKKDRRYFYACQETMASIIKQPKKQVKTKDKIEVVSYEELTSEIVDGNRRADVISDDDVDVENQVEHQILVETVRKYRNMLKPSEEKLLSEYYEEEKSEREIAKEYSVKQSTINEKRHRILNKLLRMIEEEK